jgi:hypothetical protein
MAVKMSTYTPALLYNQKYILLLIYVRVKVNPRPIVQLEGLRKLKEFNDLIGTQTHDLSACSIAPQPSTLPHTP